jgi:hypothetical protein
LGSDCSRKSSDSNRINAELAAKPQPFKNALAYAADSCAMASLTGSPE